MRTAEENPPPPGVDYIDRVNRAIDFVVANLDRAHRLDEMAEAACFSPFHFHRIFKAVVGETPNQFVKRLRLERAVSIMTHEPNRSLTDVAFACGFASSADFSRSFKQRYGSPPSAFDVQAWRDANRDGLGEFIGSHLEGLRVERLPAGENPDGFEVEIRDLPPRTMAYIRVLDPYRNTGVMDAAERLVAWAEDRGLADGRWYGYQWDDPEIVALPDCRYDVALEVESVEPAGEIGRQTFPAMQVAQIEMRGGIDLEMRALDWLYRTWLPTSRYVPDDLPAFEAWIDRPFAHGTEHFELQIQIPIRRGDRLPSK